MGSVCKIAFSPSANLFDSFFRIDSVCLPPVHKLFSGYGFLSFPAMETQQFSQSLPYHTLCICLDFFSTTNSLCIFWHNKFQQVSTDIFWQLGRHIYAIWTGGSPNKLCKCTESLSTLSTITHYNGMSPCLEATIVERLFD